MAGQLHYRFASDYRSGRGIWSAGQEIDVTPEEAEWFNRDVPGCLVLVEPEKPKAAAKEPTEEARAADKPPADRMMKAPTAKRDE